jgi:F420 biosynthesis protein FbiB-like protein
MSYCALEIKIYSAEMRKDNPHQTNLLAWLESRRSVRRFRPEPVPTDQLRRILAAATWAPSAHNRQPWRFAVLTSPEAKACLAEALAEEFRRDLLADGLSEEEVDLQLSRSRLRITGAPVAILLCLDPASGDTYRDERRKQAEALMGVQSVALAGGQLLLAAHAEGLGGVWMCAPLFACEAAQSALKLPAAWQPQALLLLGYPAQIPAPRPRRPLDEIALFY